MVGLFVIINDLIANSLKEAVKVMFLDVILTGNTHSRQIEELTTIGNALLNPAVQSDPLDVGIESRVSDVEVFNRHTEGLYNSIKAVK